MDDAAFQSNVVMKDAQIKAMFAEYYYDCTLPSSKTTQPVSENNNIKPPINTADIKISGV